MKRTFLAVALSVTFVVAGTHEVFGQQTAQSFEQLQVLVKAGDTISVTDSAGRLSKGKIADLSRSSLRLQTDGAAREFTESDVTQITQRRGDSLANGARLGLFVGLGLGALAAIGVCVVDEYDPCGSLAAFAVGAYAALGTGVGVGIDAMVVRETTVYRAANKVASSRINLAPDFTRGRKGLLLSVSF